MEFLKQNFCMKLAFHCYSLANKFYRDLSKHQLLPSTMLQNSLQWWISTVVFLHSRNRPHGMTLVNTATAGKLLARPHQAEFCCCLLLWQASCCLESSTRPPQSLKIQEITSKRLCRHRWDAKANCWWICCMSLTSWLNKYCFGLPWK